MTSCTHGIQKQTDEEATHKYRDQIGGCQWCRLRLGEMGEGDQKAQTSRYKKISHRDAMCSMMTIINNIALYI